MVITTDLEAQQDTTSFDTLEDITLDVGYAQPQMLVNAEFLIGENILKVAAMAGEALSNTAQKIKSVMEEAHLGEKLTNFRNSAGEVIENTVKNVSTTVQEAHIGDKLETAKNTVVTVVQEAQVGNKIDHAKDTVIKVVQDAHIPEKLESAKETVVHYVQDAHLKENLTQFGETTKKSVSDAMTTLVSTLSRENELIISDTVVYPAPGSVSASRSAKETLQALYGNQFAEQLVSADDPVQQEPASDSLLSRDW
jgi:vacuolar-type H+-ATPase subunit H